MKRNKQIAFFLVGVFLVTLFLRWYFTFSQAYFADDGSYFHLRHILHLVTHHELLVYDPLSFGGRTILYPPLYHILMGLLSWGNVVVLKALPQLFISLLVFPVYLLSYEVSEDAWASAWAAAISCFIPVLFLQTANTLSVFTLFIPLFFLLLYATLKLDVSDNLLYLFVVLVFFLGLLGSWSFLYVLAVGVYLFLISGWARKMGAMKKEGLLFATLFIILSLFLIYKRAFLAYGAETLYYNIPSTLLANTFSDFSAGAVLGGLGALPVILGTLGLLLAVFLNKRKPALLVCSVILSLFVLLSLKLISLEAGLLFLGVALAVVSSVSLSLFFRYLTRTKLSLLVQYKHALILLVFVLLCVFPSIFALQQVEGLDVDFVQDLQELAIVAEENDVILGSVYDGNVIAYFSERATVVDSSFLLAPDAFERVGDVGTIYMTDDGDYAKELLEKYSVDYLFLTDSADKLYTPGRLEYAYNDVSCFKKGGTYYEVRC